MDGWKSLLLLALWTCFTGVISKDGVGIKTDFHLQLELRNAEIENLLRSPEATFFTGESLTGAIFKYDSRNTTYEGGCQDLWGVQSMKISKTCVRVFQHEGCRGLSRAIYPKPDSRSFLNFLTPELETISSIGPCLPNEFEFATISYHESNIAITKDDSTVHYVPDFDDPTGESTYEPESTFLGWSTNPVIKYFMDNGRPKWIQARIQRSHLNSNDLDSAVAGINSAIPPALGGPTGAVYNYFPQSLKNFEAWEQITSQVETFLATTEQGSSVIFDMKFSYANAYGARPLGFFYRVQFDHVKVLYGFIPNYQYSSVCHSV